MDQVNLPLTVHTQLALRTMIYLARYPNKKHTIATVAYALDASSNHMVKVVRGLGSAGWLHNTRGQYGGVAISVDPHCVSAADIVRHGEQHCRRYREPRMSVLSHDAALSVDAAVHAAIRKADTAYMRAMSRMTLADLLDVVRVYEEADR